MLWYGLPSAGLVQVARAGQPRGQQADHVRIAPPEAAQVVAVVAVPFGPAQAAERAHLIAAGGVPRLGDDLRVGQQRVFGDRLDHRRIGHQLAVAVAAEDRRQIEAEAVDVIVVDPVAEAMEDHLADDRMVAVERVAAAGVVAIRAGRRFRACSRRGFPAP